MRAGERHAEDRVRPETALVRRPVEGDERGVDRRLVGGVLALERRSDRLDDVVDGLEDALAAEAGRVAVAQLDRLVGAGRRARRHRGPTDRAVLEDDIDLDRRIAPRVEDLAGVDVGDERARSLTPPQLGRSVWRTAMPGSSRPSRNSSEAPPPVLMWVIRSARPCCWTAATESPPPTTTVAPASALSARKRAIARVPWANDGISKTPSGPFQKTVRAGSSASSISAWVCLPMSTMCHEAGIFSAGRVLYSVPWVTSLATITSTGRTIRTPFDSAIARIRLASSTRSYSARLLPTDLPWATRNVLAIPPPTTIHVDLVHQVRRGPRSCPTPWPRRRPRRTAARDARAGPTAP